MADPYVKASTISLKGHPNFNEKWLQTLISGDPSMLGIGELEVRDVERRQPHAGRLDLLLIDPESHARYEVEIQLGATDESHIIRTIEYWDNERRRYPDREHIAVIVAEDITSRFLNVISLFNRAIPLVAIQLRALQVGSSVTLSATKVLDLTQTADEDEDDDSSRQVTDRAYWDKRAVKPTVALADQLLSVIHSVTGRKELALKYTKYYIGLAEQGVANNFVVMRPTKQDMTVSVRLPRADDMTARLESSSLTTLNYDVAAKSYRLKFSPSGIPQNDPELQDLIQAAAGGPVSVLGVS